MRDEGKGPDRPEIVCLTRDLVDLDLSDLTVEELETRLELAVATLWLDTEENCNTNSCSSNSGGCDTNTCSSNCGCGSNDCGSNCPPPPPL